MLYSSRFLLASIAFKEMALFKVVGNKNKLEKAFKACKKYDAVLLDKTNKSNVIQMMLIVELQ